MWKKQAPHKIEAFIIGEEREWRVQIKETRFYDAYKRHVTVCSGKYRVSACSYGDHFSQFTDHINMLLEYLSNDDSLFEGGYSVHISSSKEMVDSFPISMF